MDNTPWANIPAVATDKYVFWITNPSLAMFTVFNIWCREDGVSELGFIPQSSYNSIQIWRMDPYEFCPTNVNGVRQCPEDSSATFATLPGFIDTITAEVCSEHFLVVAPVITYVNEYNLMITVLNTTIQNINTTTLWPLNESLSRSEALLLLLTYRSLALQFLRLRVQPGGGYTTTLPGV